MEPTPKRGEIGSIFDSKNHESILIAFSYVVNVGDVALGLCRLFGGAIQVCIRCFMVLFQSCLAPGQDPDRNEDGIHGKLVQKAMDRLLSPF